jgi:prevent-host-death family protein
MAREIPVTQARAELAELVNRVGYGGERVVLTRHGKPLAALVPASDLDILEPGDSAEVISATSRIRQGMSEPQPEERRPFQIAAEHRPAGPPTPPPQGPGWRH